ncbi:MAG: biotin--[acetyl-CoA-carboxylase] ligase [Bacilli bacterium]|nr:biotin--[acetyl-CoA-carboxylase] ligase [Bacilli bacterium]
MYTIKTFESLSSTNQYVKDNYVSLPHKSVIVAKHQTAGRGRFNRLWQDEEGLNLLASILIKEDNFSYPVGQCSLAVALAVSKALDSYTRNLIKWPNDILIHNRKVAGILLEAISSNSLHAVIIGIGINVNQTLFPEELKSKTTSLAIETGHLLPLEPTLESIITHFEVEYEALKRGAFAIGEYEARLTTIGQQVTYQGTSYIAKGVNPEGALILEGLHKRIAITSGEVEHVSLYKTSQS